MASIVKSKTRHGETRYGVRWRDRAGRQHWKTTGPRRRDAQAFKEDIERRMRLGGIYEAAPQTLGAFLPGWLDRYQQRVRPSTYRRCLEVLPHLQPFEPLRIETISAAEIEDHVLHLAKRAPRQAELALRYAKQVLRNAKERGQIVDETIFRLKPPRREQAEMRFLSWPEVEELAANTVEPYNNVILFAALTGLRQGELFALSDAVIDTERRLIQVSVSAQDGEIESLKTRASRRSVHLCAEALSIHRRQLMARRANHLGLVFPAPQGGVLRRPTFLARVFRPAVERSGQQPLRFHDLRHTYAALMIRAGAHPKLLQAQMGHRSVSTTLDLYGHLYPDSYDEIGRALDTLVRDQRVQSVCSH